MTDFTFNDHGSIAILTPLTEAAKDWVAVHLPDNALTFGGGVVIEPRYVDHILEGIDEDGLTVFQ
jgi:hypothetical protein